MFQFILSNDETFRNIVREPRYAFHDYQCTLIPDAEGNIPPTRWVTRVFRYNNAFFLQVYFSQLFSTLIEIPLMEAQFNGSMKTINVLTAKILLIFMYSGDQIVVKIPMEVFARQTVSLWQMILM